MKLNGNIDNRIWTDVYVGEDAEKVKGNIYTWADVYAYKNARGK